MLITNLHFKDTLWVKQNKSGAGLWPPICHLWLQETQPLPNAWFPFTGPFQRPELRKSQHWALKPNETSSSLREEGVSSEVGTRPGPLLKCQMISTQGPGMGWTPPGMSAARTSGSRTTACLRECFLLSSSHLVISKPFWCCLFIRVSLALSTGQGQHPENLPNQGL